MAETLERILERAPPSSFGPLLVLLLVDDYCVIPLISIQTMVVQSFNHFVPPTSHRVQRVLQIAIGLNTVEPAASNL